MCIHVTAVVHCSQCVCVCAVHQRTSSLWKVFTCKSLISNIINCVCCKSNGLCLVDRYTTRAAIPEEDCSSKCLPMGKEQTEDEFDQCNSVSIWTFLFHNSSCKLNIKAAEHFDTKSSIVIYFATFGLFLFYQSMCHLCDMLLLVTDSDTTVRGQV